MSIDELILYGLAAVVAVVGVFAIWQSAQTLRKLRGDLAEAVEQRALLSRIILARGHVRRERNRLASQVLFASIGLLSFFASGGGAPFWLRLYIRLGLVIGIVLVYLNSVWEVRTRERVEAAIDAELRAAMAKARDGDDDIDPRPV